MSVLLVICVISVFIPETWPATSEIFSGQYNEITSYLWEPVNSDQRGKLVQLGTKMNMEPEPDSLFCAATYHLIMTCLSIAWV